MDDEKIVEENLPGRKSMRERTSHLRRQVGTEKIQETYAKAREILKEGTSLVVFPEGARSFTGHMGVFKKGAFQLADELQLPVVPVTINGSFDILPRTKGFGFVRRSKLTLHHPSPHPAQGKRTGEYQRNDGGSISKPSWQVSRPNDRAL